MKGSVMTIPMQQKANHRGTALTRTDVERLLQDVRSPKQLDISGQNLSGINLMNCDLRVANLSQANIYTANLCGTNLSEADVHGADLRGTYLCWADLRGANLGEADLRGANLDRAILYGTILGRADLRGVSWDTADVRGADLSWSCLGEASASELKHHLRHRGAIFRETTNVKVTERFSDKASTFALGFSLGFLLTGVVGFLGMLGMRARHHFSGLKRFFIH
jgi:uncharacterized protein YjbI with pentapeptide repeats